jgi:hypothetical protein
MRAILVLAIGLIAVTNTFARDVYVRGHVRKDGTYVAPHVRSSPDRSRANNYGPSGAESFKFSPRTRDLDRDGLPNYLDQDDDNDGRYDNYDRGNR